MTKERLMPVVKVAVSAALLYALFRKTDFNAFLNAVSSVSVFYAALAVLIYFTVQCVSAYRWSLILAKDVSVPYREILSIYFIGMFFNNFLPTIIGGDVVKGYYLYKRVGNGPKVFASIFMDRYSGFAALMTITLVALAFGYFAVYAIGGAGLIGVFVFLMGGFVCVSLFLWFKGLHDWLVKALLKVSFFRLNEKLDALYCAVMSFKGRGDILFKAFILSLAVQGGVIAGYLILGHAMGIGVKAGYFPLFIPLATVSAMLPFSFAGLGIREAVFVALFTMAGASMEEALGLSLMWFFVTVIVSVLGAFEYLRLGGWKEEVPAGKAD
ncbi:MAG: lysylphosphatidylglycerol synthase transmembrane domain-containing protein [Deltaproteobacteria bacterium]